MISEKMYRRLVRWEDLPEESPRPGVFRKAYATDQVMLVLNELEVGMELRPHVHEDYDQLACILDGEADYYIAGVPHRMTPGSMLLVPAGSEHYIQPLKGGVNGRVQNLDIFVPPREDLMHLLSYLETVDAGRGGT